MAVWFKDGVVHLESSTNEDGYVIESKDEAKAVVRALVHYLADENVETIVANGQVTFKQVPTAARQ
jgi:hypothetical protein